MARLARAALLFCGLAAGSGGVRAAETEYYRHLDPGCVAALLDYAWAQLVPAVQARCDAADVQRPLLSVGRWHAARDMCFQTGPAGWSTPEGSAGRRLEQVRFRDADGNGRWSRPEVAWIDLSGDGLFTPDEPVLGGAVAAVRSGDYGRVFPDRLYADAASAVGAAWDPAGDLWLEGGAADRADLAALHTALLGLLERYVNSLDEPAWDGGVSFAQPWTTALLLAALGQGTLVVPPVALDGSFAAARQLEAWLRQAVGTVDLLQCRLAPAGQLSARQRIASAERGPFYELHFSTRRLYIIDGMPCYVPLSGSLIGGGTSVEEGVPPGTWNTVLGWSSEDPVAVCCPIQGSPPGYLSRLTLYDQETYRLTPRLEATGRSYLGAYNLTGLALYYDGGPPDRIPSAVITRTVTVTLAEPPRNVFRYSHSQVLDEGSPPPQIRFILPSGTAVSALFATEWAAAEWLPVSCGSTGEVRAYRRELDSIDYWEDGHDTCILQKWQDCTATFSRPAGVGLEVYIHPLGKQGTPDLFAGKDCGRFWHWSTVAPGLGGPVELVFAPAGVPTVPNPIYPDGDYEASTQQIFTVHGVFDYRGLTGFAPLPPPPVLILPPSVVGAYGLDTNRDDLVEVGADLVSFGPDTGTMVLEPAWAHPQVLIPLAAALWNELPVQAFLAQGAVADGPNLEWLHPDAGASPFAFSLHSRAGVEELLISPAVQRKIVTVVRPRGNRVAFGFAWEAATGAFAALGFPLAPNQERTYVLRDLTPADDRDACFELLFDSGLSHVYSGGSLAEGALAEVRHSDGRRVQIGALTECAFGLNANTFASPRCRGVLTWSGGLLRRLEYTWRCGGGRLGVDLVYAATPAGPWVTALVKTIPELGVCHAGGFGFSAGEQELVFGSGIRLRRRGDSLTTVWPSGGALTRNTAFNAAGRPTRIEVVANGSAHATVYHYAEGSGRYPANGAPGGSKLSAIEHPDGSWERFEYEASSGWLSAHITPCGDAGLSAAAALCQVTRFGYDHTLSAGVAADPTRLTERPRLEWVETLGIETGRTYHAYGLEGGRRSVRSRRCAAAGAGWDAPGNLESLTCANPFAPPDVTTPTGTVCCRAMTPRDDRLSRTDVSSSGQTVARILNALGQAISYRCSENGGGFPLLTAEAWSGIDPFGRPVRTDALDGTYETFDELQWHGGPRRHTCSDGSLEICTYFTDGRLRNRSHYGVTTTFSYDALGQVVREQRRAGTLSVEIRTQYDSQGRQILFEDELGRRTVTLYRGMDRIVIGPDGSRETEERFLDGRRKHLSGPALSEAAYTYGVDAEGTWACTRRHTPAGFTDASTVYTDRLGRPWQTARTLDDDTLQVMSTTSFDPQGRPCRSTDADGVTTLTEYNACNEVSRTTLDLDADGHSGSADAVCSSSREVRVVKDPRDGSWSAGTRLSGSSASGAVTESFRAADGGRSWSLHNGRLSHSLTVLGADPGERRVTTTFPAGRTRIESYAEGLLCRVGEFDAGGEEVAVETYEYDALRRLVGVRDGRTGVITTVELDAAGQIRRRARSDSDAATEIDFDALGHPTRIRQPGGGEALYDYDPAGRLTCADGAGTLPCRYQYESRGGRCGLQTYRDGLDGGGAVRTEWLYDDHSGRLGERRLAGTAVEAYHYSPAGRLERLVRHLPDGPVSSTFTRDAAGAVVEVSHSDGSAGVSIERDRSGRPVQISDAGGRRDLGWDRDDRLISETLPQLPGAALLATYDAGGRRTALTLRRYGTDLLTWSWAYDAAGRLESVSDGHGSTRYEYLPGASLVARTVCRQGGAERLSIEYDWDDAGRLTEIVAELPGPAWRTVAAWQYQLDDDGRRTAVDAFLADPADTGSPFACRWEYAYDPLGQLRAAVCRESERGAVLPGRDFAYEHDSICNRIAAGRREPGRATGAEQYVSNDLNQYTVRIVPGAVYLSGVADPGASVTVNGEATERDGAAFHIRLPVDNSAGPVTLALAIRAVRPDPATGLDLIALAEDSVRVPAATELLATAAQGALAADSLYTYRWDLDDRLLASTPTDPDPRTPRFTFAYDSQGRRLAKQAFRFVPTATTKGGGGGAWALEAETVFVWDGWTLLAELEIPPAGGEPELRRSYLWGLDLDGWRSGSPGAAAGGIGGLLAATSYAPATAFPVPESTLFAVADANGSIAAWVEAGPDGAAARVVETVEYEPFGAVLARRRAGSEPLPAQAEPLCPFGFSTRYVDSGSALVYYGYRYYRPDLGRWLCRDPLAEQGGPNLYAYCQNDPINLIDPLGEKAYGNDYTGPVGPYDWQETAYTQAEVDQVYADLAARDRHIYNPGLANTSEARESSRHLLEETLGVPVGVVWNPTFVRLGSEVSEVGEYIGGHGWTWNPLKLLGNTLGGVAGVAGSVLTVGGVVLDVVVAGAEKMPVVRKAEPTYLCSMNLYKEALQHVMAQGDTNARVYGWMHSEGAIHGTGVLAALSAAETRRVTARTFGAGGYLFPKAVPVEHYACISSGGWRDPVSQFAGLNVVRDKPDLVWAQTSKRGWPHGMETYVEYVILGIAKDYFRQNAQQIIGR